VRRVDGKRDTPDYIFMREQVVPHTGKASPIFLMDERHDPSGIFGGTAVVVRPLRKAAHVAFQESRTLFDDVRWRAEYEGAISKDDVRIVNSTTAARVRRPNRLFV